MGMLTVASVLIVAVIVTVCGSSSPISRLPISRRLLYDADRLPYFVDTATSKLMAETANATVVVAKDGTGAFKTITEAIASLPEENNETIVVRVKAGVYHEYVVIPKNKNNIKLIGDGALSTRISGNKSFARGTPVYDSATLAVNSEGFMAKDIAIENTAGPDMNRAVAVRVSGDKAIFHNVHIEGYQATLYADRHRQYYRDCVISGTVDFIFGEAVAVFQNCKTLIRKPGDDMQNCVVTAQGRKKRSGVSATVIQNCTIVCEPGFAKGEPLVEAFLGRPSQMYSRTIIMQSFIDECIAPQGWTTWMGKYEVDTLYYAEYENRGPGSNMSGRVTWKGIRHITRKVAEKFSAGKLFVNDEWVRSSGIPYDAGMMP